MIKDLNGKVVPHPTEYIVMVGNEVTPISKRIAYNRIAQFVYKSDALAFAKSITSYHTAVIDPDPNPNNELVIRCTEVYLEDMLNDPRYLRPSRDERS
jgi:hypothetical protein